MHISKLTVATGDDARTYASFYPHAIYTESSSSDASHSKAAASTHHESFESAGPRAPLCRSSSISSISSAYSTASDDSWSSTDSSSPDEGFPIIGILKKSRRRSRGGNTTQGGGWGSNYYWNEQGSSHHNSHDGESRRDNLQSGKEGEEAAVQEDEENSWEDADSASDCDIIFERHVTFTDPVATDIVDGSPVPQSVLSRTEWTALRMRMKLERMLRKPSDKAPDGNGNDWVDCEPTKNGKGKGRAGRRKKTVRVRKARKRIYVTRYDPSTTMPRKTPLRDLSQCC
ncbi:hypothetical protein F4678DRAFT_454023 [Xylaria arbuscula]|nr:hypothetical protein F4678DRAFT_454023 [Xylaria arbuscula]